MSQRRRKSAWERVEMARAQTRPISSNYLDALFDDFIELHGDRYFGDDTAIVAGIATFKGRPVTVISQEKGHDTNERIKRNFGSPHPEGYRKALRLMKQAEKFARPIICFVDTQGAFCGLGAEERGQGRAIAENLQEMFTLKTPIISVVIGEGGSGGALALAVADKVAVLENAVYTILSPEGFASILWKDSSRAQEAADVMKLTAQELKELGVIDDVILEPEGGAQENPADMAKTLEKYIERELKSLSKFSTDKLLKRRFEKFRNIGKVEDLASEKTKIKNNKNKNKPDENINDKSKNNDDDQNKESK